MIKCAGGVLIPADDLAAEKMQSLKTAELHTVEIKQTRNPAFHRKMFAFFNFCYEHFDGAKIMEHGTPEAQFDRFRKDLTILAGYYEQTVRLNGEIRTEAKSLAVGNMDPDEFKKCYTALINAASKNIFNNNITDKTYNKLLSFF